MPSCYLYAKGQFHVRIQEFIMVLIAVMSRLDAVVAGINVLYPMENQCVAFKLMLQFKYMVYFNFASNYRKTIKFHVL